MCIHIHPSSEKDLPPTPMPSIWVITEHRAVLHVLPSSFLLPISPKKCIYVNATLPICSTLSFPPGIHKPILYLCISIPAQKNRSSSTIFLDSIFMH